MGENSRAKQQGKQGRGKVSERGAVPGKNGKPQQDGEDRRARTLAKWSVGESVIEPKRTPLFYGGAGGQGRARSITCNAVKGFRIWNRNRGVTSCAKWGLEEKVMKDGPG